jgi:hypothetical protein
LVIRNAGTDAGGFIESFHPHQNRLSVHEVPHDR